MITSCIVGVEEDKATYSLKPKIGWFVRKSDMEEENLSRLEKQNDYRGMELEVDEVPEILKKNRMYKVFDN